MPGFIDYLSITDAKVRDIALAHMAAMVAVLGIFAFSFWLRWVGTMGALPAAVSALGVTLLGIGAWLGGEMVFVHGQGMVGPARRNDSHEESGSRRRRVA